jgi:hypothetical protein
MTTTFLGTPLVAIIRTVKEEKRCRASSMHGVKKKDSCKHGNESLASMKCSDIDE